MSAPSIVRRQLDAQPILFIRRDTSPEALAGVLGECFGRLFSLGYSKGLPISGAPIARYVSMGPGAWTIEAAMPLAVAATGIADQEILAGELPAGPAAFAVHTGPYETLSQTHAAIAQWMRGEGCEPAGPPWESYVTDPGQQPDPAQWQTEVFWPLRP